MRTITLTRNKEVLSMPVYVCLRGDADVSVLDKTGEFEVTDTEGREWLCYVSSEPAITGGQNHPEGKTLGDTVRLQRKLHEMGASEHGSQMCEIDCDDVE